MPRARAFLPLPALLALALTGCGGGRHDDHAATSAAPGATATTATGAARDAHRPRARVRARPGRRRSSSPVVAHKVVGIGEQGAAMFDSPAFRALGVTRVRRVVPWDAMRLPAERALTDAWLAAARADGVEPFITFGASRVRPGVLPSVAAFRAAFAAFHRRYPQVRVLAPWNEMNHRSQPTWRDPARAAAYFEVVRDGCPGCTVLGADVLDQPGMDRYLAAFRAALHGPAPQVWGLHNYGDTNRFRTSGTQAMLRSVPGEVWITETGGIARFGSSFPFSLARQARATAFTFRLLDLSPRITRLYLYNWTGAAPSARFDAGLTDPSGAPRPAYRALAQRLRSG